MRILIVEDEIRLAEVLGEIMKENKYDDLKFFNKYSEMPRSKDGLESAGEWPILKEMLPKFNDKNVLDIGCGCSFGIYLIHILFLDGYKKYAEPTTVSAWIAVPVLIAGIGGLSLLCVTLLRRSRIGRAIT